MGRTAPMNPSPAGKPAIRSLGTPKQHGAIPVRAATGPEYSQVSYASKGVGSAATPTQKGGLSAAPTPGSEYRQVSSK